MSKIKAAILGPGNIGTDLLHKIIRRSHHLELCLADGIKPSSKVYNIAREHGIEASDRSIDAILARDDIGIVFDATTASAHKGHEPLLQEAFTAPK